MSQFSFKNIGHFFATVAGDIVRGARAVATVMQKAEKAEPEIEALSVYSFRRPLSSSAEPSRFSDWQPRQ